MPAGRSTGSHGTRSTAPRPNAYELIRDAIFHGDLKPGEPLREVQLATWCGVSRTPVREALRRLEQDGLVCEDGPALVVRLRSPEEIIDIYNTRIVLEGTAAALAADRRTEHDIRQIEWALQREAAVADDDVAGKARTAHAFSGQIWHASHNECLIDLLTRLRLHLGRFPESTFTAEGMWERSQALHRELLEAILRRDEAAAKAVAERHFTKAREIRLALFAAEAGAAPAVRRA